MPSLNWPRLRKDTKDGTLFFFKKQIRQEKRRSDRDLRQRHADVKPNDSPLFRGGPIHLSIAFGSKEAVVLLTERLRQDGYTVFSEPRQTGDGYFESGVLDPEGNRLELTI